MLLGGAEYLAAFHDAYRAAGRHLKHGAWYIDVHTSTTAVMVGDLEPAVDTLRAFHTLWRHLGVNRRRHLGVHPEGFNLVNLEVQQGQTGYPLRPEHAESLFYAHRATGGSEWLRAGADVLRSLQALVVPCGVAALSDVVNRTAEDTMESFFLSETLKYLYLLFDPDDAVYTHGKYVFTTEAHPLPLALGLHNASLFERPSFGCALPTAAQRAGVFGDEPAGSNTKAHLAEHLAGHASDEASDDSQVALAPYRGALRLLASRAAVQPAKFLLWGGAPPSAAAPLAELLRLYESEAAGNKDAAALSVSIGRKCASHADCFALGLTGDCCPTTTGVYIACCGKPPPAGGGPTAASSHPLHGIDFDALITRRPDLAEPLARARDASVVGKGETAVLRVGPGGLRLSSGQELSAEQVVQMQGVGISALSLPDLLTALGAVDPATGEPAGALDGHTLVALAPEAARARPAESAGRRGGAADLAAGDRPGRPRLSDTVEVIIGGFKDGGDARRGEEAEVVQDDRDSKPFILRFADGTLGSHFYPESAVRLVRRGPRPSVGDEVVIGRSGDPRDGQRATIVQDDQDTTPYRLKFADGTVSVSFYEQAHVGAAGSEPPSRAAIAGLSGSIFAQLAAEEPQECRRLAATLGGGSPSEHAEVGET
ncbi:hypothetical protein EMIHUDRAFT_237798 [Emiliania huxleyi CCMP1516]|uniref:alpha-1,2-Mannosidase n=2 Tax=Emiliania huxleyi TaxID=2903 RepID=A0A0D3JPD3_EMIH1|nr:hypothetical protein EMIHUDRAFT_237798 [Emiliania huxleyi CCMP1516]EOD25368.1 hypothetical protein EMIHUDRAFT_237798 [Emiliania huxleyi CCMP1516]|eukprot:XP_005777797.1 hypothetical protein EMIHUDRAFT_237798 [Emiliania huxleyi CCMP1516]